MNGHETEQRSEAARLLAQSRRIIEQQCVICGKTIEGTTRRQYCGNACRKKAYFARNRERILAKEKAARTAKKESKNG